MSWAWRPRSISPSMGSVSRGSPVRASTAWTRSRSRSIATWVSSVWPSTARRTSRTEPTRMPRISTGAPGLSPRVEPANSTITGLTSGIARIGGRGRILEQDELGADSAGLAIDKGGRCLELDPADQQRLQRGQLRD